MKKPKPHPPTMILMPKGSYTDFKGNSRVILSAPMPDDDCQRVGVMQVHSDDDDATAEKFVRAYNTHERLIAVIQKIMDNDDAITKNGRDQWDVNFEKPIREEVEKLLAEARGGRNDH